jgi:hypothetical protein
LKENINLIICQVGQKNTKLNYYTLRFKTRIQVFEVSTNCDFLHDEDAFVLDAGLKIFIKNSRKVFKNENLALFHWWHFLEVWQRNKESFI